MERSPASRTRISGRRKRPARASTLARRRFGASAAVREVRRA